MDITKAIDTAVTGGKNISLFGLSQIKTELKHIMDDETAAMEEKVISLTVILVIIAVVLIPVGYVTFKTTDITANGTITPSVTETTIFNVIPLLVLVGVILGIIAMFTKKGN